MEGISGLKNIRGLFYGNVEYNDARELLTNDVNAVIKGLYAGGADVVHVVDAHGSGNPEPDILLENMDSRAELVYMDEHFRPYVDLTESDLYDGIAVVCMHSKTGGGGFGAHTFTLGMDWIFNDMSVNETEIIAYSWGRVGVPVIFAAGDNTLRDQLTWMSWLEYSTGKTATSASSANIGSLEDVYVDMSSTAKRAIENLRLSKAVKLSEPVKAGLRAVHPASLAILDGVPGIQYENETVTFEAEDFQVAYDGIVALIGVARTGYQQLLRNALNDHPDGGTINRQFSDGLVKRWTDVESDRWNPPEQAAIRSTSQRYFGAR